MKLAPLLLVLTLTVPLAAQGPITNKQIATICRAPVLGMIASYDKQPQGVLADPADPARPSIAAFARASAQLLSGVERPRFIVALVSSAEINAHAHTAPELSIVCIPSAMTDFMGNEDELAFILGHEIGHVIDSECPKTVHRRQDQILCEIRADEIGFKLLVGSGYSPYAAAGAFGRIEMYSGDTQTGIVGMLQQFVSDHPITPNRIANMRRLLLAETHP